MKQIIQDYNMIFMDIATCYNVGDPNITRKIIHSFDVAKTCYMIASYKGFSLEKKNLCYLIGLFHDVGRFKQWEKYQTYNDKLSEDHGDLSKLVLDSIDCRKQFYISDREIEILKYAVSYHTKEYDGEDNEIKEYIDIIKNADAYSNVFSTACGMQQIFVNEDGYNKDLLEDFKNQKKLTKYCYKTKLDRALMLTACCYYVEYDFLRNKIVKANYIDSIYEMFSNYLNQEDKKIFKEAIECLKKNYAV